MKVKHLIRHDLSLTVSLLLDRRLEFQIETHIKLVKIIKTYTINAIKIHRLLLSFTIFRHGKVALMADLKQTAQSESDYITI